LAKVSRYSLEDIKRFVEIESDSGCLLTSTEKTDRGHIRVYLVCECGEPFVTDFYLFKTKGKRQCVHCNGYSNSIEKIRKVAEEKGCSVLSQTYVNNKTKMEFLCKCGESFTTTFKCLNQQNKTTCDRCMKKVLSERYRKTNEDFDRQLLNITEDIVRVGDYMKMSEKVLVKHMHCENEWPANPSDLLHKKSGCPYCSESKGEKRIANHLTSLSLNFERQYKINECRNIRPLPFDFAIFDNGDLKMLIEYDGVQHFDKTCFGGKSYEDTIKNDAIKTEYCSTKSIPLLRINYKDMEMIESILSDALAN
jgi:hypothetical protein